jgi:hypothetical protein
MKMFIQRLYDLPGYAYHYVPKPHSVVCRARDALQTTAALTQRACPIRECWSLPEVAYHTWMLWSDELDMICKLSDESATDVIISV